MKFKSKAVESEAAAMCKYKSSGAAGIAANDLQ